MDLPISKHTVAILLAFFMRAAIAQQTHIDPNSFPALKQAETVTHVARVFSQLLRYQLEGTFKPAFEDKKPQFYKLEYVPGSETVQKWTQMFTVTGMAGVSALPNYTPEAHVATIAAGFRRACPETFNALSGGASVIDRHDAFTAVLSCGTLKYGSNVLSETVLIIAVKGSNDAYTLQWAERGTAVADSKTLVTDLKWAGRIKAMRPVLVCTVLPGEQMPYPSCMTRTQ